MASFVQKFYENHIPFEVPNDENRRRSVAREMVQSHRDAIKPYELVGTIMHKGGALLNSSDWMWLMAFLDDEMKKIGGNIHGIGNEQQPECSKQPAFTAAVCKMHTVGKVQGQCCKKKVPQQKKEGKLPAVKYPAYYQHTAEAERG